jgi:hypothetical protein
LVSSEDEREEEKIQEGIRSGWKDASKFYTKNPKAVPAHPFDDLIRQKQQAEEERAKVIEKIKEANKSYRPTPIALSWTELMEYQRKLYPQNHRTHQIIVDDTNVGDILNICWNMNERLHGRLAPVMRQLIAIVKKVREDYGVKMELVDGGRLVKLTDKNGNSMQRPPEPWEEKEFPEVFAGARKADL